MKLSKTLLTAILALFVVTGASACTGMITDEGVVSGETGGGETPLTPEEDAAQQKICKGDGEAGGACDVSADCNAPMVCLSGTCVGPQDPSYTCDMIEGIDCLQDGESCINGLCIATPGACTTLDECPNGYTCAAGQCTPVRDGSVCASPGPGPALAGTYKTDSVLHLREALPGVVVQLLNLSEEARKIINGDVNLGFSGIVDFFVGALVAGVVRSYVPPYALDIVTALATIGDVLDNMQVEGTLTLDGEACDGNYRGRHEWNFVTFQVNGVPQRVKPNDLPGVDNVVPEDFAARYYCGDLLIDRHRISNSMGTLIRWLLDTSAKAISGYNTMEDALASLVDCPAVGNSLASASGYPISGFASAACQGLLNAAKVKVTQAIDQATVSMSLIKLRAIVPVNADGTMGAGTWYGSLVGGDFSGTLSVSK